MSRTFVYRIGARLGRRATSADALTLGPPEPQTAPSPPKRAARTKKARAVVWTFLFGVLVLHLATAGAMDVVWPELRDPEYGRRAKQLRARVAKHPNRPLVLTVGSSRTAMGVRPAVWEEARLGTPNDPLVFNVSACGGGPITQLLLLRRIYADGFRPAVVLLEYWPPVLRQDGRFSEAARFDQRRLRWDDRPVVRDYFPEPAAIERRMRASRLNALSENRARLLVQVDPLWVPVTMQSAQSWTGLDGWGWLPGMDPHPDDTATRRKLTETIWKHFADQLNGAAIHPDSDRALREAVALARAHGTRVGFVCLPESAEFQGRYPAELERSAREHLTGLSRELAVPIIDARNWMDERYLADGFHLSRAGAAAFTAKFVPAVVATFPGAGGSP